MVEKEQSQSRERARRLTAIGYMCGAYVCFALLDATAKYLATVKALPVVEIVWLRYVANAVFILFLLGSTSLPGAWRTSKPGWQWMRSFLVLSATFCNFIAVKYLQLDQTVTIFFATPLFVALLAGPFLGEWIGMRRLLAIIAGFLGVIVVTRPGFGGIHWAVVFSFAAMASYALYSLITRYLAAHDAVAVTQFYTPLAGLLFTTPFALLAWQWPENIFTWVLIAALGLTGGGGHWLVVQAHQHAPAPILAPFIYTQIIWMNVMGYLIFADVATLWTLAGGAIVIASGLYLLWRERAAG